MHYSYPQQALFGKVIPKNKIYDHADITSSMREKFVQQIDKITWQYKLAPETINLPATENVSEIQVFEIRIRTEELDETILRIIDKAIPFQIVFHIIKPGKIKVKGAFKRPSDADKSKWVVESYFESPWLDDTVSQAPIPIALNLGKLYELILQSVIPEDYNVDLIQGSIKEHVDRIELIKMKEREYDKIKIKRDKEKQFNRKAELNTQLKLVQKELEELRRNDA